MRMSGSLTTVVPDVGDQLTVLSQKERPVITSCTNVSLMWVKWV